MAIKSKKKTTKKGKKPVKKATKSVKKATKSAKKVTKKKVKKATKPAKKATKSAKKVTKKKVKKATKPAKKATKSKAGRRPAVKKKAPIKRSTPARFAPKPALVDVKNLSLQDALDFAILIENEAAERYAELAMQLEAHGTPEAAAFFRKMAGHERQHGDQLTMRRRLIAGAAPSRVTHTMIPELEVTDYDEARAFMTAHAALRVAMANEVRAERFYVDACAEARLPEVRDLFNGLAAEEVEHQQWIREAAAKLPPEDSVDQHHFADEPVGH